MEQCGTPLPPDEELMKNYRDDDSEDDSKLVADEAGLIHSEERKVLKKGKQLETRKWVHKRISEAMNEE